MSKIEMMEVNQHTSDEVAKVLADLEAQDVDIAALQTALTAQGTNINTILSKLNSGGSSVVKSVQRGTITISNGKTESSMTINAVNTNKAFILHDGVKYDNTSGSTTVKKDISSSVVALEFSGSNAVRAVRGAGEYAAYVLFHVVEFV